MSSKRKKTKAKGVDEFNNSKRKGRQRIKTQPSDSESSDNASEEKSSADSDVEDSSDNGETRTPKSMSRKSGRLRKCRRRQFRMPSRGEVWDKIPSTPAGRTSYTHLLPRRLINSFTKGNSQYNYDPAYTSGEDSVDEFIVPDDEVSANESSGESDTPESTNTDGRSEGEGRGSENNNRSTESDGSSNQYGRMLRKRKSRTRIKTSRRASDSSSDDHSSGSKRRENSDEEGDSFAYAGSRKDGVELPSRPKKSVRRGPPKGYARSRNRGSNSDSETASRSSDKGDSGKSSGYADGNKTPRKRSSQGRASVKERFAGFRAARKKKRK